MTEDRYPESGKVYRPSVSWLRANRGYVELFNDSTHVGARVDSVGRMDGRLFLVEVKDRLDARAVRFDGSRPGGTIEAKISGALRNVALGSRDDLSRAISETLPTSERPVVAILARRYSDGAIDSLAAMLADRSTAWEFDWQIWRWTGARVEVLGEGAGSGDGFPAAERIPRQVPPPGFRTKGSRERVRALAEQHGVLELFDLATAMAPEAGLKRLTATASNQNFACCVDGKWLNVFGLYPTGSSAENGLNVSARVDQLPWHPRVPPHLAPAPQTGHLNANLFVCEARELAALLACFVDPRGQNKHGDTP